MKEYYFVIPSLGSQKTLEQKSGEKMFKTAHLLTVKQRMLSKLIPATSSAA